MVRSAHYTALFVEHGHWNEDEGIPTAPIPLHERTWRHPSEIGRAEWVASEPALVVGRGLTVASGVIGITLALGILWLMIPQPASPGITAASSEQATQPRQRSAVVTSAAIALSEPTTTLFFARSVTSTSPSFVTTVSTPQEATIADSIETIPANPTQPTEAATPEVQSTEIPAFAVQIGGHFVVTTAEAVHGRSTRLVQLPSGQTASGSVVDIDVASHTAVLAVDIDSDSDIAEPISLSNDPVNQLTIQGRERMLASLDPDLAGTLVVPGGVEPDEASFVYSSDGSFVGLCTMLDHLPQLVPAAVIQQAMEMAMLNQTINRLGLTLARSDPRQLVVSEVVPNGPAALAGVLPGDLIVGIAGEPITSHDYFDHLLAIGQTGGGFYIDVARANMPGVEVKLNIVLGPPATEP